VGTRLSPSRDAPSGEAALHGPAGIDITTGFLLGKNFGARLEPDETVPGHPRGRASRRALLVVGRTRRVGGKCSADVSLHW